MDFNPKRNIKSYLVNIENKVLSIVSSTDVKSVVLAVRDEREHTLSPRRNTKISVLQAYMANQTDL